MCCQDISMTLKVLNQNCKFYKKTTEFPKKDQENLNQTKTQNCCSQIPCGRITISTLALDEWVEGLQMYLGLRMCSLLILKIPHIPVEILLPNLLLPFIVQHGCMYICCTSRAWYSIYIRCIKEEDFSSLGKQKKDCAEGYVKKCLVWLSVHICLWAAAVSTQDEWHLCERVDLLKRH